MIKQIDRYLTHTVAKAILLVVVMVFGLEIFMWFVGEMDTIGRGNYHLFSALYYVLLQVPFQVYLLFPIICLIGTVMGMGLLASHQELVVMQVSGMSIIRIIRTITILAFGLSLLMMLLGEGLFTRTVNMAENLKVRKISAGKAVRTHLGIWLKEDNKFIHIGQAKPDGTLYHISEFNFAPTQELRVARSADYANYQDEQWTLHRIKQTEFLPSITATSEQSSMKWDLDDSPHVVTASQIMPEELSLYELYQYMSEQSEEQAASSIYELTFWKRLLQPFATAVMMLIAIPFVFGPLRSASSGYRLVWGISLGFAFYILNQLFGPVSLLYGFPPAVGVMTPIFLYLGLAVFLVRRLS